MSRDSNLSAKFSLSSLLWIALLCVFWLFFLSLGSGLHVKGIEWRECARPSKKGRKRPRLPCCLPFSMHWLFVCLFCLPGQFIYRLGISFAFFWACPHWPVVSLVSSSGQLVSKQINVSIKENCSCEITSKHWPSEQQMKKGHCVKDTFQKGVLQFY